MDSGLLYRNSDITLFSGNILYLFVRAEEQQNSFSLVIKKEGVAQENIIYTSETDSVIYDFQVADNSSVLSIIWRERVNLLFTPSVCHYAEVDSTLTLKNHTVISQSESLPQRLVCLRGIRQDDYLLTACVDVIRKRVVLNSFKITDFSSAAQPVIIDDEVNPAYLDSRQPYSANVTFISDETGNLYLQFLLASGSLRVYRVARDKQSGAVSTDKLFDFAEEDTGFHDAIVDVENKMMVTVFSGLKQPDEENNIYIAIQHLFMAVSENVSLPAVTTGIVNQTHGSFWRPSVISDNGNYLIAWEGSEVHYITLDQDLSIEIAEKEIAIQAPGNVLLYPGRYLSCQTGTLSDKDMGTGYNFQRLNNAEGK